MTPAKPVKHARTQKAAKTSVPKPQQTGSWEQWYPLPNDPDLSAAGVEIGARVMAELRRRPQLRIVFRIGDKEARVECLRLAMYPGPLGSFPLDEELARSPAHRPVKLPAEEQFFALNSYVAGIADVGIRGMFTIAREDGSLPIGFNSVMQSQILRALLRLTPAVALDLYTLILEYESLDGTQSRRDPVLKDNVKSDLAQLLSKNTIMPPELLAHLSGDGSTNIRRLVAKHRNTAPEVLARLAGDVDMNVRLNVAGNKRASPEILARLAGDRESNAYVQARAKETLEDQKKNFKGVNPPKKKIKKQLRKPANRP